MENTPLKKQKNTQSVPKTYFVQTRNQTGFHRDSVAGVSLNVIDDKMRSSLRLDAEPTKKYGINLQNIIAEDAYDLPSSEHKKQTANLIHLWEKTFKQIVGAGRVIISPYGSLSYMIKDGKVWWQFLKDLDFAFYLLDCNTKYEAWQFEKKYRDRIIEAFAKIIKDTGIKVYKNAVEHLLAQLIEKYKIARQNVSAVTFGNIFNANSFFSRINYTYTEESITLDAKNNFNQLKEKIDGYLDTKKIYEDSEVYYSWKFKKDTDYSNLVLAAFLRAYFQNVKVFAPVFWDWVKTSDVLYDIFIKLNLISDNSSKKDFLDNIIKKHLEYYLIPQLEPFEADEVRKYYPRMPEVILEGWTQAIIYYLKAGGKVRTNDILIRDHIDTGSVSALLCLITGQLNIDNQKKEKYLWYLEQLDKLKEPNPTIEHATKRVQGNLRDAQLLLIALKNLIKPIKEEGMDEETAIKYLKNCGKDKSLLSSFISLMQEVSEGKHTQIDLVAAQGWRQLKNEFQKLSDAADNKRIENFYIYSPDRSVAVLSDKWGITDTEFKYLYLAQETNVLVQYSEIKNGDGKIKGYRYHNVGRHPFKQDVSILGLMEFLTVIEMLFQPKEELSSRQNMWNGHSRPDIMITGPACSQNSYCSFIPPKILAALIEDFVEYKDKHRIVYTELNYEKPLPDEFLSKIYSCLFEKNVIKHIQTINDFLKTMQIEAKLLDDDEINAMLIVVPDQESKKNFYFYMGEAELRFLPITFFTMPTNIQGQWWDFVPKGYRYYLSYFGDEIAINKLKEILYNNLGGYSPALILDQALKDFRSGKRIRGVPDANNKKEIIKALKEAIRSFYIIDPADAEVQKLLDALKNIDKDENFSHTKDIVQKAWQALNSFGDDLVVKKINERVNNVVKEK